MLTQKYSVNQQTISVLLAWVQSGEIAIPEIQRPFVWDATRVRDLMDSLFQGYPVGYVISWQNPSVRLKDGSRASGKKIMIDGQQRITALRAALLGEQVVNKEYDKVRIRIAFHPVEGRFEVQTPIITKDKAWVPDISEVIGSGNPMKVTKQYQALHPEVDEDLLYGNISNLMDIPKKQIGIIELASDLDIETVTEIFIRINSQGVVLSQADFAMSKIAANEAYGGNVLRKAIDYFCNLAVNPGFHDHIENSDKEFLKTEYYARMAWMRNEVDDIYDPSYSDLLRVAFTSEFGRGRMSDLVSLLSGRNFETREFEETIASESFRRLGESSLRFMNETDFKRFVMIVRSAGFIDSSMIRSQNALNFAYVVYLTLRAQKMDPALIERSVAKWLVLSLLTGRYSGSPESTFDYDIRQINSRSFTEFLQAVEESDLSEGFWTAGLVRDLNISVSSSPAFNVFLAAQVKANDKGFLSRDITVGNLIAYKGDIHHLFPKSYLKSHNLNRGLYNQVANYVYMQQEINIKVGAKSPEVYFAELVNQCEGGQRKYGHIDSKEELVENLRTHCIPESIISMHIAHYEDFLEERRKLMAMKIRGYYERL